MSLPHSPEPLRFGSLRIAALRLDAAVQQILALIDAQRGGAVFTPNVDHLVRLDRDADFHASYSKAALLLADGMPVVWASRLLGTPLPERVAGADVLPRLLEALAERGAKVGFLGGRVGMAERLRPKLDPRLRVWFGPPTRALPDEASVDAAMHEACTQNLDLLVVSLASPAQEHACARWIERLAPTVSVGLGSAPDVLAGMVSRAPKWARERGLEWSYRLLSEPRRLWRRYLLDGARFAPLLWKELRKR